MQPRKYPRDIPQKPHYLTIDLADPAGETTWRIPSMAKAARLLQLLQTSGFLEAAAQAENGGDIIANMGENLTALFSVQGALLGMCWFHPTQDLETKIDKFNNDLNRYGEEIYEELHEAGWEMGHIQTCFVELVQKVVDAFVSQKEVAEKVDFLSHNAGKPN